MLECPQRWRSAVAAMTLSVTVLAVSPAHAAPAITNGYVTSFDGTKIAYTYFLPDAATAGAPVPVVFDTHGWGGNRTTTATGMPGKLLSNGYAVLTWDARGFGDSGGEANVDSADYEVRDVQALIDFAASKPEVLKDGPGDPRMGMTGGSYAGGIQLMTASFDSRIDAIAPEIAWNDLIRSLKPNGVLKLGWGSVLYASGTASSAGYGLDAPGGPQTGGLSPMIHRGYAEGLALNDWSPETHAWFDARGPEHYLGLGTLRAPALIIQGASDTLFNLNEGIDNYNTIRSLGLESRLVVFCGGHTLAVAGSTCTPGAGQRSRIDGRIFSWFDRYLKDNLEADLGPDVEYQLQDGTWATSSSLPGITVTAKAEGVLVNQIAPTSGTGTAATPSPDGIKSTVLTAGADPVTILGVPTVRAEVSGAGAESYLFFKLVDVAPDGTQKVLDDQVTPVKVTGLSLDAQTVDVELAGVSWRLDPGHTLQLQIASTSSDYASSRLPSVTNVEAALNVPASGVATGTKSGSSGPCRDGRRGVTRGCERATRPAARG
ncbi:MAG TPA: CocE/NonD family hydrolase [Actinomycetota bacterium]|nr:CocE/NonD family hydrolase [Actinomycetota bacterium]